MTTCIRPVAWLGAITVPVLLCYLTCIKSGSHVPESDMQELGLPYEISPNDFEAPDPADMMMLVLYLYQSLPQLVPRGTVDFTCKLNETQVRLCGVLQPTLCHGSFRYGDASMMCFI